MKQWIISILILILITGCVKTPAKKDTLKKDVQAAKVVSGQTREKEDSKEVEAVIELQPPPPDVKPIEPIPTYTENRTFSEVLGFPEYVAGPLDVLAITFWKGTTPETVPILVRPDGKISFSFLEDVSVSGLTPTQIDNLITEKLSAYVKKPRIDVIVKEYNSKKVSLFGAINRLQTGISGPGIYPITGRLTMLDLILVAGGHSEQADLTKVELTRKGKIYKINLYTALFQGESSQNILIESGDRIVIPDLPQYEEGKMIDRKIFVLGEVKNPGLYKFKKTLTVLEAVTLAGGVTMNSVEEDTKILRGDDKKRYILSSDLTKLLKGADLSQNLLMEDGDIIFVPRSKITDVAEYFHKLSYIFSGLLFPAQFRDAYTTGGGLRFDTGLPPSQTQTPSQVIVR